VQTYRYLSKNIKRHRRGEHNYLPGSRTDSRWRRLMAIVPGLGPVARRHNADTP